MRHLVRAHEKVFRLFLIHVCCLNHPALITGSLFPPDRLLPCKRPDPKWMESWLSVTAEIIKWNIFHSYYVTTWRFVMFLCTTGGNDEARVTLSKRSIKPARRTGSQAYSCCVLCSVHSAPAPSVQTASVPTPASYSATQLLSPLDPPPHRPPFLPQDAVQWHAYQRSQTVLVLMCLSAEEITRKQLATGRQLLFPAACGTFWGQQQDAVGEKWLHGPAAPLRQDPCTGQGQVGSGSGLCCGSGLRGCEDLELIYGLNYHAVIGLR